MDTSVLIYSSKNLFQGCGGGSPQAGARGGDPLPQREGRHRPRRRPPRGVQRHLLPGFYRRRRIRECTRAHIRTGLTKKSTVSGS